MLRTAIAWISVLCWVVANAASGQDRKAPMPREDVVEVPAVGEGLCVSNLFQSNMVLQRDAPVRIWGWAKPGETITVSFGERTGTAVAGADRTWTVTLDALPANAAPQVMRIRGRERTLELGNVLVGDVWVLGGQSNMEFELPKVDGGALEAASAHFPEIRLLTLPRGKGFDSVRSFERLHEWSDWFNQHFRKGDWDVCSPAAVQEFSAIGYVFGRRVYMATQVPIGLIDASIGGTTVETWTPEPVLRAVEGQETRDLLASWEAKIAAYDPKADLARRVADHERKLADLAKRGEAPPKDSAPPRDLRPGPAEDVNRPGFCYAGVIRPLEGLAVKGAVFHQGFNNCFDGSPGARMYQQVFGKMIAAWRAAFGKPDLPFCIISLCTAGEPQTHENFLPPMYDAGTLIREAQYRTFLELRQGGDRAIGFVSSFDLRKSWYHPQIKIPAGERAAAWALTACYGVLKGEEFWLPPIVRKVERGDGVLRLTLSARVVTRDDSVQVFEGFAIAGEDRRFYPAVARYETVPNARDGKPAEKRDVLLLSSPFVPAPVHYRYAWARNPLGNVVNERQIPLAAQRSDDWVMEETPTRFPGSDDKNQARRIAGLLQKELELSDMERAIREAEATLERLKERYATERSAFDAKKEAELRKRKN